MIRVPNSDPYPFLKNPKSSAPCLQFLHELLRLLSLQAALIRLGLDRFCQHRKEVDGFFVNGPKKDRSVERLGFRRPGKHRKSIKKLLNMAIEIVELPMKNGDFP